MTTPPPLAADPAESPWIAFRRLMRIVTGCAVAAVVAALAALQFTGAPQRWELWAAVAGGVAGTVLLTGALMGLVFVSSRSGHDDHVGRSDTP
ncbi:MAG: hypothetical protein WCO11_13525 [Sphingomonadales bacterium]|jgi:hypothetical protein